MYATKIDNIIDDVLNKLYLEELYTNEMINHIINNKIINFVEYFDKINVSISDFTDGIDKISIQEIVNSKENVIHIVNIVKRYVAYYFFLYIGFYYKGSDKDYRNNIIQFSKLQENSKYNIKNFFDTENNYQLVLFYKLINNISSMILMSELQRKSLDEITMKSAIDFVNKFGESYINNYLLMINPDNKDSVEVNVHNLIKTIIFFELYQNQERQSIFNILNEISENESESIYINVVVSVDISKDFDNFKKMFIDKERIKSEKLARNFYDLINSSPEVTSMFNDNFKNNILFSIPRITPIGDDFLRYHKESFKTDTNDKNPILLTKNNDYDIKMILRQQKRERKDNSAISLILNKIDTIQNLYSQNVKGNIELENKIKQYFSEPHINRKIVWCNYIEELEFLNKMMTTDMFITDLDEYLIEMLYVTTHAYFNFKDFKQYGSQINYDLNKTINLLRYSNIEYPTSNQLIDIRTATTQSTINLVGITIGPFNGKQIRCIHKDNLVNIRNVDIFYYKNNNKINVSTDNGYTRFLRLMKYYYIDTIVAKRDNNVYLSYDYSKLKSLNHTLSNKIIHWIYDPEIDIFKSSTYESSDQKSLLLNINNNININIDDFHEKIKKMNAQLYNKIMSYFKSKLKQLIHDSNEFTTDNIHNLINMYCNKYYVVLSSGEIDSLINYHLINKEKLPIKDIIVKPEKNDSIYVKPSNTTHYIIQIDFKNPLKPKKYDFDIESKVNTQSIDIADHSKCIHEDDLANLHIIQRDKSPDDFKKAMTNFLQTYMIESTISEYACKICGQILQFAHFVQDSKFSNVAGRYVTPYSSVAISLKTVKEYVNYPKTITYLGKLIKRMSFLSGTNMLSGTNDAIKQRKNNVIKQIIDLFTAYYSINTKNNIADNLKQFDIDKKFSSVLFFELDDEIFDFNVANISQHNDINKLKINNIILYFILIFMSEINGLQIIMSNFDKYDNVYVYLKYGEKLFGDLKIRRNISDNTNVPIMNYPILCYVIYSLAYLLDKYKIWQQSMPSSSTKTFNPSVLKNIIVSLVELLNGIIINYDNLSHNYAYSLFIGKFFSQLNNVFSDSNIINILKNKHIAFSDDAKKQVIVEKEKVPIVYLSNPPIIKEQKYKIPAFKISTGIQYDNKQNILYEIDDILNDKIICPTGDYHHWFMKNGTMICTKCGTKYMDNVGDMNMINESYYFTEKNFIDRLSKKICSGSENINVETDDGKLMQLVCDKNIKHDNKFVDNVESVLQNINNKQNTHFIENQYKYEKQIIKTIDSKTNVVNDMLNNFKNNYGIITKIIDEFISNITNIIGDKIDLNIDKYPMHINDDVYIIDHYYDNTVPQEPMIFAHKNNKVIFKENHLFFKSDVFYYVDNRNSPVEVFYDAVTLKMIGYKQKNNEYITNFTYINYLKINYSIKNKLLLLGYPSKYTTSSHTYEQLDNLIRDHIQITKINIDKFSRLISKIINFVDKKDIEFKFLSTSQIINTITQKYATLLGKKVIVGNFFDDWVNIRNDFSYDQIDWEKMKINIDSDFIQMTFINYYDVPSALMMNYLVTQFNTLLNDNPDKSIKGNISMMYIELINYVFSINNVDSMKNKLEVKRYQYILNGSEVMIDLLRRGQGLLMSDQMEKQLSEIASGVDIMEPSADMSLVDEIDSEELEDIKEEADALDVEIEEDDEYAYSDYE